METYLYWYHDIDSDTVAQARLKVTLHDFVGVVMHAEELSHCAHRPYKITNMYGNTDGLNIVYLSPLPALLVW